MVSSTDVAARAGVSRSAVSQILNGHAHRFTTETVDRVQDAARALEYRPSHAGRSLRRGRSDLVVTLVHDRTFGPQVRDFLNALTADLASAGLNHVLQLVSSAGGAGVDSILGLQPLAVVCTGALPPDDRAAFSARGITVIEGEVSIRDPLDLAIGALQAEHLVRAGYDAIASVRPPLTVGYLGAEAREAGAREWAAAYGVAVLPTLVVDELDRGWTNHVSLPTGGVGLACYNDELALAALNLSRRIGRAVPDDLGIIGADDSSLSRISMPTITTIRLNMAPSREKLLQVILGEIGHSSEAALEASPAPNLTVIEGESTRPRS